MAGMFYRRLGPDERVITRFIIPFCVSRRKAIAGVHSRGLVSWCQVSAGSGGSQGFPSMAPRMASSAVTPWAAAESR